MVEQQCFLEYLGQVFEAYVRMGNMLEADAFARGFLDDPASPSEGMPELGVPLARQLMMVGRSADSLQMYERMAHVAPTHPLCAEAWYWMALVAHKQGKGERVKECAICIRIAQGTLVGTLDAWNLDIRAYLFLANLEPSDVDSLATKYTSEHIRSQLNIINCDLARL